MNGQTEEGSCDGGRDSGSREERDGERKRGKISAYLILGTFRVSSDYFLRNRQYLEIVLKNLFLLGFSICFMLKCDLHVNSDLPSNLVLADCQ